MEVDMWWTFAVAMAADPVGGPLEVHADYTPAPEALWRWAVDVQRDCAQRLEASDRLRPAHAYELWVRLFVDAGAAHPRVVDPVVALPLDPTLDEPRGNWQVCFGESAAAVPLPVGIEDGAYQLRVQSAPLPAPPTKLQGKVPDELVAALTRTVQACAALAGETGTFSIVVDAKAAEPVTVERTPPGPERAADCIELSLVDLAFTRAERLRFTATVAGR